MLLHHQAPPQLPQLLHHSAPIHTCSRSSLQVGNAMLRGISGGQKKRVTAGEMLVSVQGG